MRRPEFVARQGSRPEGWLGSLLALVMRWETAAENDAALELLRLEPTDRYLEVGFGHARTLARAAGRTRIAVGVDASPDMARRASTLLRDRIAAGFAEIHCASGPDLPFPSGAFDKILCVHTLYFWRDPALHLTEFRRVLAPGGRLVLGARPDSPRVQARFPSTVYSFRSAAHTAGLLGIAGFSQVHVGGPSRGVDLFCATPGT